MRKIEVDDSTAKAIISMAEDSKFLTRLERVVKDISAALGRKNLSGASLEVIGMIFMQASTEVSLYRVGVLASTRYEYEAIGLMQAGDGYDAERYADLKQMMVDLMQKHQAIQTLANRIYQGEPA